ncbi:hypothetical protein Q0L71_13340, partial [Staphylococcus aureus]|nr:hypothetical protein [Staphylococcus aureus]
IENENQEILYVDMKKQTVQS